MSYILICTKVKIKDQGQDWVNVIDTCKSQNSHLLIFFNIEDNVSHVHIFFLENTLYRSVIFFSQIIKDCMNVFNTKYICVTCILKSVTFKHVFLALWLTPIIIPFREWESSFLLVWICCYLTIIRFYRK